MQGALLDKVPFLATAVADLILDFLPPRTLKEAMSKAIAASTMIFLS